MTEVIAMGVDPDLHSTGVAICRGIRPLALYLIRPPSKAVGARAVAHMIQAARQETWDCYTVSRLAVEKPQFYVTNTSAPEDLLNLAAVAGGMVGVLGGIYPVARVALPHPADWKGQVPKDIHHRNLCARLGWTYKDVRGHVFPTNVDPSILRSDIPVSGWNHVLDAIALAHWAATPLADVTMGRAL